MNAMAVKLHAFMTSQRDDGGIGFSVSGSNDELFRFNQTWFS
jgi:hypothetical protein